MFMLYLNVLLSDLAFSTKQYENVEKCYSPSKTNESNFDTNLMTFNPIPYNEEISSEFNSNLLSGEKCSFGDKKKNSCSLPSFARKPAEVK